MTQIELEDYRASMKIVERWFNAGIINESDLSKAESFLAKKYCIKDDELYRVNSLLLKSNRAINIVGNNNDSDTKESNASKNVTRIEKKN